MITNSRFTSKFTLSPWRRIFCSLFFLGAFVAFVGTIAVSRQPAVAAGAGGGYASQPGKIASWVMEHTANGQQAEFLVVLADKADLSGAASLPTKAEKGRFVYQTLLEKAQTTQEPILQWLRDRNVEYQSFYIVNAILVKGNRQLATTLAARPDVARVTGNPEIHNNLPQPGPIEVSPSGHGTPATVEPGIAYTHAPDVWALGFTGQNI